MPNSSSSIASSQATLEEAIKHDIVNDLDDVVDTVNDWPGSHVKANECAGITCGSCNDELCAGHELDKRCTTADTQERLTPRQKPA